jgi:Golgi transport complex subunit 5
MADEEPSYIDYEAFLDPEFSAISFANSLVTSTNDANDTPLDLSTPLSRVLFDLQEIDTHIHTLTTKSALPLLTYTREQADSSERILKEVESQVTLLTEGYQRLEKEVLRKWESADRVRIASENSWATLRLARAVGRCISLGKQLEGQLTEVGGRGNGKEDHKALVRAANTLLQLRQMFSASEEGQEGFGIDKVKVVRTLKSDLVIPAENTVKARAQQVINKFSVSSLTAESTGAAGSNGTQPPSSSPSTFVQTEEIKARTTSAVMTLYLLSPMAKSSVPASEFHPELLLSTLQGCIHTYLASSLAALSRALAMLPILERTLLEVSARCQDIAALEVLLETLKPPVHPFLSYSVAAETSGDTGVESHQAPASTHKGTNNGQSSLLQPLLQALDTPSLPSYFWRSLASSLPSRVQEIINRGGVSARTLKSNRERLRSDFRDCVLRGSQLPSVIAKGARSGPIMVGNWEREAAVMVSSVVGSLGR